MSPARKNSLSKHLRFRPRRIRVLFFFIYERANPCKFNKEDLKTNVESYFIAFETKRAIKLLTATRTWIKSAICIVASAGGVDFSRGKTQVPAPGCLTTAHNLGPILGRWQVAFSSNILRDCLSWISLHMPAKTNNLLLKKPS